MKNRKLTEKLFWAITALLTVTFTLFGIWMMTGNFAQLMKKETEQADKASQMFRFLFEMGYQSNAEYGQVYAISRTLDSITQNVEQDGSRLFVLDEEGTFYAGEASLQGTALEEEALLLQERVLENNKQTGKGYGYCIRETAEGSFLLNMVLAKLDTGTVSLGLCRNLTPIYQEREILLNRYRLALVVLLAAGGAGAGFIACYLTKPIRSLEQVAGKIAEGQYELRSRNTNGDAIGELAKSFNHMADRLVEQMEEKEREAKRQEDFTAAFAHELKTPLTSIIGYADMMNTMKLSEEERAEAVFYIYSQGKRLESLSFKLLELVGMDRQTFVKRKISTKQLEENLRATVRPIWEKKEIRGKIEMDRGYLWGEESLLLSLFYNLLDNGAKAMDKGEKGFLLLKGTALPDGAYEVKVVDNGRGIPREEISRITEAFYMVDKSRSRKEGGAGIGMALCRKIIQLHGAVLQIDSRLGDGTVMRVVFPAEGKLRK